MEYSRSQRWLRPNALEKLKSQTKFWGHGWIQKQNELIQLFKSSQQTVNIVIVQILIQFSRPNLCTAFIRVNFCIHSKLKRGFSQKKKKLKRDWSWIIMKLTGISRTPADDITQSLHHTKCRTYISRADYLFGSPTNFQIVHKP